ncbi:Mitogen-activated protein kinase kinase kinase 7 [Gryllus bimaculatus]|nr:Mitogen-activated protein kinase kinase kinase 7 [Gryllus bimaculatus]
MALKRSRVVKRPCKSQVYKVMVTEDNHTWFVFRRYNEFHKLYEFLKKQVPQPQLKLPGKKLFGNNLDPTFIQSRREGLDAFIRQVMEDNRLVQIPEVREFFHLDRRKLSSEEGSVEESSEDGQKEVTREKVLSKKLIMKRNEAKHIMSERNVLLKNLHHPFLVGLHYSFQTPDKLYFVLDYVNGGELFFHLQRERVFSEARSRFYSAEIASALGYLHAHGIVYRDLKPENLLLDSVGHVILTDFGLSKEGLLPTDTTNTFCGTPEYLAPEVLRKEGYDKSVDWWCLGAVLYEMLYGLPPFYSRNTADMYDRILHKPLVLRSSVSENARDILAKLLHKDQHRRLGSGYRGFDEVKHHQFFKLINWEDLLAKRIPPPFNPNVKHVMDLRNIDPEFTKEPVPASVGHSQPACVLSASVREADEIFAGFSYAPPMDIE